MKNNEKIISTNDMVEIFKNIKGCSFVSFETLTKPKLIGGKNNPQQNRITVLSKFVGFCGDNANYEKMVNKKIFNESKNIFKNKKIDFVPFIAEELWNGKGKKLNGAVIYHTETLEKYIYIFIPENSKPLVKYFLDSKEIEKNSVIGLMEKNNIKTFSINENEITIKMIPRIFKLSSILSFKIDGITYKIKN